MSSRLEDLLYADDIDMRLGRGLDLAIIDPNRLSLDDKEERLPDAPFSKPVH